MFTERRLHYGWLVAAAATLALLVSAGLRSVFGVLIHPLEAEFGWGRATLGAIAALSLFLYGAVGPLAGRLADRLGPRWVFVGSLLVLGVGTLSAAYVANLWQLYLTAGILMAVGAGGAAMSPATSLAARWFEARRGLVLGILGAGMAAGQLLIIPFAMHVTVSYGWRTSLTTLALVILLGVTPLVALIVRDDPARLGLLPFGASARGTASRSEKGITGPDRTPIAEALRTMPFWLLAGSFFICGYTSAGLVLTHFIPHAMDHGIHAVKAAGALGLMGAMNIIGTIASGWICDRFGRVRPLAMYYALRGLTLVLAPWIYGSATLYLFAVFFGLNYISTVPPTSSLTARIFGARSAGELYGWIFVSHQIGAALGSWGGGYLYEATGTYTLAFLSAATLAFLASGLVLVIRDAPQPRLALRPIPA